MSNLVESVWISKTIYDDAEEHYYSSMSKAALTPLAGEIAKARQKLIQSRDTFNNDVGDASSIDVQAIKFMEKKVVEFEQKMNSILDFMKSFEQRIATLENLSKQASGGGQPLHEIDVKSAPKTQSAPAVKDDDDVDLFGSDSEDDEEAAKIRDERLAAYAAKKSKKPVLIAKSNVILDVKPWDDETDMKKMEEEVRKIQCDGLLWGAAKLQPLAYGINKLQISAVVEDDKVSIDWLTEQIEAIEDLVQSVDIAAFNKI